ncbi:hypothetical protein Q4525_01445 [Shimia thalassica]|uniref:hypothetical protein n=1 Tax=Shimia thalassica TaxID=1715693 RepID=UPI001C08BE3A|nr:hypothetical protein [Shimia thalassica]MBU2943495.1 hypothetical protein [Shimia thalassica]MDO6501565.1 hypothetical protein [Shimia thalassica]
MSAPVCENKLQCQLNGLVGTAMFLSVMILLWAGYDMLSTGMPLKGAMFLALLLAPTLASLAFAALMKQTGRSMGWAGLAFTAGGAAWGVFVLNGVTHL